MVQNELCSLIKKDLGSQHSRLKLYLQALRVQKTLQSLGELFRSLHTK